MAWRTADDQARQLTIGHLLEQVDQEFGEPVELEAGEGGADEVAEQQSLAGSCRPVRVGNTQQPPVGPEVRRGVQQQPAIAGQQGSRRLQGGGDAAHQPGPPGGLIGARSRPPISAITRKAPTAAENCPASIARRAHSLMAKICSAWWRRRSEISSSTIR